MTNEQTDYIQGLENKYQEFLKEVGLTDNLIFKTLYFQGAAQGVNTINDKIKGRAPTDTSELDTSLDIASLTVADIFKTFPRNIISYGTCINSLNDIYMTSSRIGDKLSWVAVRGGLPDPDADWAIYVYWAGENIAYIAEHGDKLTNKAYIKKLTNCTDEALALYRF